MPEMPEVETVRLGLKPVLEGRVLKRVVLRRADLRLPFPPGFRAALEGRRVQAVDRRGKYLLFRLDGGLALIAHLGMSGRFRVHKRAPPPPGKHDHVVFETDHGVQVYYHDPRRFGLMTLAREKELDRHRLLAGMGPEPLNDFVDGAYLAARLKGRGCSVKAALLDQGVIAGIGNIYASEILFRSGISPRRAAASIKGARARRLAQAIKEVLSEAVAAGGSSLRDHRAPDGGLGYFQQRLAVYGRAGEPCPDCACDPARTGGVRRLVQSGRSTFYCANRQR